MAYGLRYQFSFWDIHPLHQSLWSVSMSFNGFTGTVTQLTDLGDVPMQINYGKNGTDKFDPIIGSEVILKIIITNESVVNPADFIVVAEDDILVQIFKDGAMYWEGYVMQDFINYQYRAVPYELNIECTDRIGLLKNDLLSIQDDINNNGLVRILDLIKDRGLFTIGTALNLKVASSLVHPESGSITYPGTTQKTFLDELYIRYELLMDSSTGYPISKYDAMSIVATSFGGRIFYSNGSFHFQRISDLFTPAPLVSIFTTNVYPDSQSNVNLRKNLTGDVNTGDGIYANLNAQVTIDGAYGSVTNKLKYVLKSYLLNQAWADFGAYGQTNPSFNHWGEYIHQAGTTADLDGSAEFLQHGAGTQQNPYTCFIKYYSAGTAYITQSVTGVSLGDIFTLKFDVKYFGIQKFAYQIMVSGPEDSTSSNPGLIHTFFYNGSNQYILDDTHKIGDPMYNMYAQRGSDLRKNTSTINVTLPVIQRIYVAQLNPISVTPTAMSVAIIDPDVLVSDGTASGSEGIEIGAVSLGTEPMGYNGETDLQTSVNAYSTKPEENNDLMIDSFDAFANSILYGTSGVYNSSWGYWTDGFINDNNINAYATAATTDPVAQALIEATLKYEVWQLKNLREIINQAKIPYQQLQTDVFSNTIDFENVIQQVAESNKPFLQISDQYDVKACLHKMVLLEIENPADFTSVGTLTYQF